MHRPKPTFQPGQSIDSYQREIAAWDAEHVAAGREGPPGADVGAPPDPYENLTSEQLQAIISDPESLEDEVTRASVVLNARGPEEPLTPVPIPGTDSVGLYDSAGNLVKTVAAADVAGGGGGAAPRVQFPSERELQAAQAEELRGRPGEAILERGFERGEAVLGREFEAEEAVLERGFQREESAADRAVQRSQIEAQNLSTFIDSTINQLSAEIDAGRLKTEQAIGEFNRRMDAFSEAGSQFERLQPFTIPRGVDFIPGFEPKGIATRLGLETQRATPALIDPFQMAADIVAGTPNIADIGVPETGLLDEAVQIARGFL